MAMNASPTLAGRTPRKTPKMAAFVNPRWLPILLLILAVQAAVLAFIVWFLMADDDEPALVSLREG